MDPLFYCPPAAALTPIPDQDCGERFDQIQRFFFQRKQSTPSFSPSTILLAATWLPLIAASDDTLIVMTPRMPGVTIPTNEVLTEGGNDNTTLNGVPRLLGLGSVAVTAQMEDVNGAIRKAVRKLANESTGDSNIWMYMINRFNQIIANEDGSGFDVFNIMVGDAGTEGFNKPNIANVSMGLPAGWSDNAKVFNPTAPFKPLTLKVA